MPTVPPRCRGSRPKVRSVSAAARKSSVYITRGLPCARALRSCGSVKTTWKYGMGSRSALRAASHRSLVRV